MDIYVTEVKFENEVLNVFTEADVENCTAVSQMIVDSDDFSFIYLPERSYSTSDLIIYLRCKNYHYQFSFAHFSDVFTPS